MTDRSFGTPADVITTSLGELFEILAPEEKSRIIGFMLREDFPPSEESSTSAEEKLERMKQRVNALRDSEKEALLQHLLRDNAALAAQRERLWQNAHYDAVTGECGVLARAAGKDEVDRELARIDRHGGQLTLCLIDVDDFKKINDTYGHYTGDEVLRVVARQIKQHIRPADVVVRWGGDEFLVLLLESAKSAGRVLGKRLQNKEEPIELRINTRRVIPVEISMGHKHLAIEPGTLASQIGDDFEIARDEIIKNIDRKMYRQKSTRKKNGARG
jgi:diguanylate cyclase (GGDEF)-like protein